MGGAMSALRLVRLLLLLLAAALAVAAARLLSGLGAPEATDGLPAPSITLSVDPERAAAIVVR